MCNVKKKIYSYTFHLQYPTILQCPIRTMKGTSPILRSSCMASFKVSPLRDNCSSVGRNRIFTREIRPAFSTEEWAYKSRRCVKTIVNVIRLRRGYCRGGGNTDLIWSVGHQSCVQGRVVHVLVELGTQLQNLVFPGSQQSDQRTLTDCALNGRDEEED